MTQSKDIDFEGALNLAIEKYKMEGKLTDSGLEEILDEIKDYYNQEGRPPETQLSYIFEQAIPDGYRDDYLTVPRIDGFAGFTEDFLEHGDHKLAVMEKGNFVYLKGQYEEYKSSITTDDSQLVYYPQKITDSEWQSIQDSSLGNLKNAYAGSIEDHEIELFEFKNRSKITTEHARAEPLLFSFSAPQVKEKLALEEKLERQSDILGGQIDKKTIGANVEKSNLNSLSPAKPKLKFKL